MGKTDWESPPAGIWEMAAGIEARAQRGAPAKNQASSVAGVGARSPEW